MTLALASQFSVYLPWVNACLACESASRCIRLFRRCRIRLCRGLLGCRWLWNLRELPFEALIVYSDGEMMMTCLWWAEGWWTQRLWWRCCQWQCPCGSNRTWTRNWCFHRLKGLFPGHILKMDRLLHLRSGELTPYPAHRPGTAGPTMTALSDRRRWSRWTPSWTSGTGWQRTRLCPAGSGTEQESCTSLSLLH